MRLLYGIFVNPIIIYIMTQVNKGKNKPIWPNKYGV